MRLIFDEEYEDVDSSIRDYDDNKYCLFIDSAGSNEAPSTIEVIGMNGWKLFTLLMDI